MSRLSEPVRLAILGWLATLATALAITPALAERGYLVVAAAILGGAVALGYLLRRARTPTPLVLAAQLAVVVEALLVGYGDSLLFGILPTGGTLDSIERTVRGGIEVAQAYAAPAPADPGLRLLVVFGICVVGVLVDFLAVTLRRSALAGLPLLLLYSVPVGLLPEGVPFLAFLPGAVGYLMLVTSDQRDRLMHWGRLVARSETDDSGLVDTRGLAATGRRISAGALAAAVVLPIFIPTFGDTFLTGDDGDGRGNGPGNGADLSFDDPVVSLATSLRRPTEVDVLEVTGDVRPQYLRLVALDQVDGNGWSAAPVDMDSALALDQIPPPVGVREDVATNPHTMIISTTAGFPGDSSWLPVPFATKSVSVDPADWRFIPSDHTVTSLREDSAAGLRPYTAAYSTIDPTPEQLTSDSPPPDDIRSRYGLMPERVPQIVIDTARAITVGARSNYDEAVMLQDWFRDRENFEYDVDTGYGYGFEAMATFLDRRRGFCQHFAATMAIMARALGIPSRVVVGFLQPDRREGDAWVLTSHDVHSWPELYFSGVGWVRFEPTPGRGAPIPAWTAKPLRPRGPSSTLGPTPTAQEPTPDRPQQTDRDRQAGASAPSEGGHWPSGRWLVALVVIGLALSPGAIRWGLRRRRLGGSGGDGGSDRAAAESAWTELRDYVLDLRLPWTGSLTPRARERTLAPYVGADSGAAAALRRLALSVERARYASSGLAGARPSDDVRAVMASMARGADRGSRLRATLWPASLLPDARTGLERLADRLRRRSGDTAGYPGGHQ